MPPTAPSSADYFLEDYPRTLFPLTSTRLLVETSGQVLLNFVHNRLLAGPPGVPSQHRCYAAKRGHNLRRTVKLDPAAEFFLYDIVFRNRKSFRPDHQTSRRSFGNRFGGGHAEPGAKAYSGFRAAVAEGRQRHRHVLKVDVATYFNSIYQHDLVDLVRGIGWPNQDVDTLGTFLRQINSGRSVDCLPHGLHPCKALGSEFLRFVDNSARLKSSLFLRFMDDMHLFDDAYPELVSDLLTIQELLGEMGLSLNDSKTLIGEVTEVDVPKQIDAIKQTLFRARERTFEVSGILSEDDDSEEDESLSEEQLSYLFQLLQSPDMEESDAELVLALLRDHAAAVIPHLRDFLWWYPGLTRSIYHYVRLANDKDGLDALLLDFIRSAPTTTEYQLFWLGKILEDFLPTSPLFGQLAIALFQHPKATILSRAKILEIPDLRFGLPEMRYSVLRSGRSDWEAWAAACGTRSVQAAGRNHLLSYFANASPTNELIAECLRALP